MSGELFDEQVAHLGEAHFLVLSWAAQAEDRKLRYNMTNCFDDLKAAALTRTKQTAVSTVEALHALRFVDLRGEANRKHIYITTFGAKALEALLMRRAFAPKPSAFLEGR